MNKRFKIKLNLNTLWVKNLKKSKWTLEDVEENAYKLFFESEFTLDERKQLHFVYYKNIFCYIKLYYNTRVNIYNL